MAILGKRTADFLVEIGTEELPPKALRSLMSAFATELSSVLAENRLDFTAATALASPRRLAVIVAGLAKRQQDREVVAKGPPVSVAFDRDGEATAAAVAFAKKCGVGVAELQRMKTDKGEYLSFSSVDKGRRAAELIPQLVENALQELPIPRRMRWGDSDQEFVRPVHWVILLHGKKVVVGSVLGVEAGADTRGHRFLAPEKIRITEPSKYVSELEKDGFVLVDFEQRRQKIIAGVNQAGVEGGGVAVGDDDLYDEVTALVEWPVPLTGRFDAAFLTLPREVIVATLTSHQRYFPVEDKLGNLLPAFVTVANIESRDPDKVRHGNERVIRPRLADAAFFWEADRQTRLADRQTALQSVVYQKGLGSIADKSARIARLAVEICVQLEEDPSDAERAALLSKCDLQTGMVGEFPELQGVMGSYYAQEDGEPLKVALAIGEQYLPRFSGDELPEGTAGQALAIADRLDTLAGVFALGRKPTGNRDPFGLRRAALGIVRIVIERELELDIVRLIDTAVNLQPVEELHAAQVAAELHEFMIERMRSWYLERRSVNAEMFESVRARRPVSLLDFDQRLVAVSAFVRLESAESLAAANKRIANILRKAELRSEPALDVGKLADPAEKELYEAMQSATSAIAPLLRKRAYTDALTRLADLRPVVDQFFDAVMVMTDDETLKNNRLALLAELRALFLDIADISRLSISKE